MQEDSSTSEHGHGQQLNESQLHHPIFQYPEGFPSVNKLAMIFERHDDSRGTQILVVRNVNSWQEVWQIRKASMVWISVQLVAMLHQSSYMWRCDMIFIVYSHLIMQHC